MKNQIWNQDSVQNGADIEGVAETGDYFGSSLVVGDFNGNGYDDLAISVSSDDVGTIANAGAVNAIYGSNNGLTSTVDQIWNQDSVQNGADIEGEAEAGDYFGNRLAVGDFNGDGKDDLAIAVTYEDIGTLSAAGVVNAIYGSNAGLTSTADQIWSQNSVQNGADIEGEAEADDYFGSSLAVGDFNGDGKDDLAIGVLGEDVGTLEAAGAVNVIYGSNAGLTSTGDQIWNQDSVQNGADIEGVAEAGDYFGSSLAVGDFNGDGKDDLAIGVLGEDVGTSAAAGAVNVIYGSNAGLTSTGDQIWNQDTVQNGADIEGAAEAGDYFGNSLAVGDFNGDGKDDLAIGAHFEDIDAITDAGGVNVIYGSNAGLASTGDQIWNQDSVQNGADIEGAAEAGDHFGASLAVGDFNGDGKDDLAIGVPGERVGTLTDAGAVNVIYGSNAGLTSTADQIWTQNSVQNGVNIEGVAQAGDRFGSSLGVGDFNNDSFADLAIGVPGEDVGTLTNAGTVNILYGSATGLRA